MCIGFRLTLYRVKGYFAGQNPEARQIDVESLAIARFTVDHLKRKGFEVEVRDPNGKIISVDSGP
jgi:hypothetical protein